jgi:hypothetical protein
MIKWTYEGIEVESISDFPNESYGFIYVITHLPTNKKYIGKKILYFTRKVKLGKKELKQYEGLVGRRPSYKLAIKESDWKDYWGSNKELQELIKTEPPENWDKQIIKACSSKKLLTYYETKYLFVYQVLENPEEFWNDNILGKFYTKDFD